MPIVMGTGEAFAVYTVDGVPATVGNFIKLQDAFLDTGQLVQARSVAAILNRLLDALNGLAVEYAGLATNSIIMHIEASHSARRPRDGEMESHIISIPGPLGRVDVAPFEELDKIRNPRGGKPYWPAQEWGTGQHGVPRQAGRPLFGTFYESEEPPDPAQAGLGGGRDVAFIPMGSAPGLGTIHVELPPRHFLTDGSAVAGTRYLRAIDEAQQRTNRELRRLLAESRARGARRYVHHTSA